MVGVSEVSFTIICGGLDTTLRVLAAAPLEVASMLILDAPERLAWDSEQRSSLLCSICLTLSLTLCSGAQGLLIST